LAIGHLGIAGVPFLPRQVVFEEPIRLAIAWVVVVVVVVGRYRADAMNRFPALTSQNQQSKSRQQK
jgi:hypothetical protein